LGVRERARFLGRVEFADLVRLYQSADLFVYPSLSETFGKPPLEAMACGAPVVASNVGSIPEVVGDAALLVNPNDVLDIADKIEQVITSPMMAQELVSRGRERVRHYSWERVANETISALTRIVDR
jgi:glycosyltransferase involved in cell wall biosynthesis